MIRALVCGGRDADPTAVWNWLEQFGHQDAADATRKSSTAKITCIIHGGARGADEGAGRWGHEEHIPVHRFSANWKKHGKAAGPIRNARMIAEGKPDVVIAFPGGRGTRNCLKQARAAGVRVILVGWSDEQA